MANGWALTLNGQTFGAAGAAYAAASIARKVVSDRHVDSGAAELGGPNSQQGGMAWAQGVGQVLRRR